MHRDHIFFKQGMKQTIKITQFRDGMIFTIGGFKTNRSTVLYNGDKLNLENNKE